MPRVRPAERRFILNRLNGEAQRDLDGLWLVAKDSNDFMGTIQDGYPGIVDPYHQLAAEMAADWFEQSDDNSDYIASVADPLEPDRLAGSVEWALHVGEGAAGLALLAGSLQRCVFDGARDTTILNTANTRARWAVMASPDCCDYCSMLGARGAVYASQETAEAAIAGFHDNCKCVAVEDR